MDSPARLCYMPRIQAGFHNDFSYFSVVLPPLLLFWSLKHTHPMLVTLWPRFMCIWCNLLWRQLSMGARWGQWLLLSLLGPSNMWCRHPACKTVCNLWARVGTNIWSSTSANGRASLHNTDANTTPTLMMCLVALYAAHSPPRTPITYRGLSPLHFTDSFLRNPHQVLL